MTVNNARPSSFVQITTTSDWEQLMLSMQVPDCVTGQPGSTDLKCSINSGGRTADMAAGYALIRGQIWGTTAVVSTAIPAASGHDRIDKLVLRLDRQAVTAATVVQPVVITGTPAVVPNPPAILSTTRYQDIPIGQWVAKSDGTLISLQDIRVFSSGQIWLFTSGERPSPAKPGIGFETDTNSALIWNGTNWKYITPAFGNNTSFQNSDATLPASGTVQDLLDATFTGDGLSQLQIIAAVPGAKRDWSKTVPPCAAVVALFIDGNQVDQQWIYIPTDVPTGQHVNGVTLVYRTSGAAGDTPSSGAHTVHLKAWVSAGNVPIVLAGNPNYRIRLQIGPSFQ